MDIRKQFAETLKNKMRGESINSEDLAGILNVHTGTVIAWLKGSRIPKTIHIERMAELFNCSVAEMYEGAEPAVNIEEYPAVKKLRADHKSLSGIVAGLRAENENLKKALAPMVTAPVSGGVLLEDYINTMRSAGATEIVIKL